MNDYKVLMVDDYEGKVFTFSIDVEARGLFTAEYLARSEFPKADVIKITLVKQQ